MSLYVQIVNNEVKQVWDTPPQEGVGNNGWKNAIEVRPNITPNRQGYTGHTFDLTKDPVQIVYGTFDITVDDRKGQMKSNAAFQFQQTVNKQAQAVVSGGTYDSDAVAAAHDKMVADVATIEAATTHDELDAITL